MSEMTLGMVRRTCGRDTIRQAATDAPQLSSGNGSANPKTVLGNQILAETIDYQLAVLTTHSEFDTQVRSLTGGAAQLIANGGLDKLPGTPALSNQCDTVGWEYSVETRRWRDGDSMATANDDNTWRKAA